MSDSTKLPSLLPYLKIQEGLALDFLTIAEDVVDLSKRPYPFAVLSDADPIAHLLQARFVTGAGDTIRHVGALVEKDHFSLAEDAVFPMANPDVEAAWERAFSVYRGDSNSGLLLLPPQIDQNGALVRLAPLFYCTAKSLFFHPPCPYCGRSLWLCTDDNRLIASGLSPYSRSLKRYLACDSPGCPGAAVFYVYELTRSDPPAVKDRLDLIRALSGLREAFDPDGEFPCKDCEDTMGCFGPDQTATSRITPFSFYPFYLLIFDSASISALDFLALLSGATAEEVMDGLRRRREYGRANCVERLQKNEGRRLFSQDGERLFLEVLYLKLTLLAEIIRSMPGSDQFVHPAFRPSLDRIWVKLADQSTFLPSFWTFSAHPLDLYCSFSNDGIDIGPLSRPDLYSLALMWFYVFLVNERQGFAEISREIRRLIGRDSTEGRVDETIRRNDRASVFSFTNTFWHPTDGPVTVTEPSLLIWEKCMESGRSLLNSALRGNDDRSKGHLLSELDILRQEVHDRLFSPLTPDAAGAEASSMEDAAVYRVLRGIAAKWRTRAEKEAPPVAEPIRPEEEEITVETIFLTPQKRQEKPTGGPSPAEDDLEKTMVLSPTHVERASEPAEPKSGPIDDDLEKTVIIGTGGIAAAPPVEKNALEKNPKKVPEDDMEATLIISLSDQDKLRGRK